MSLCRLLFRATIALAVLAPAAFPQNNKSDKDEQARAASTVVKSKSNITNNREAAQGESNASSHPANSSDQTKQTETKQKDASKK